MELQPCGPKLSRVHSFGSCRQKSQSQAGIIKVVPLSHTAGPQVPTAGSITCMMGITQPTKEQATWWTWQFKAGSLRDQGWRDEAVALRSQDRGIHSTQGVGSYTSWCRFQGEQLIIRQLTGRDVKKILTYLSQVVPHTGAR